MRSVPLELTGTHLNHAQHEQLHRACAGEPTHMPLLAAVFVRTREGVRGMRVRAHARVRVCASARIPAAAGRQWCVWVCGLRALQADRVRDRHQGRVWE